MIDVVMPQLGESVERGTITRWLKKAGDRVAVDEPLFEVASDKVTMEIPSLVAGTLAEIIVAEGEEAPTGAPLARIDEKVSTATPNASTATPNVILSPSKDENTSRTSGESLTLRQAQRDSGELGDRSSLLSPVVLRLAREHRVDLDRVRGSAAGGRITKRDLLAHIAAAPAAVAPSARTEPLSPVRRALAQRLTAAQKSAVNVFSAIEIDMERVAAERERRGLTYLPFVARAVVDALLAYPVLNATIAGDGSSLTYHDAVHLGIAVDLDQAGLVVPVIRNAQDLGVDELSREIARLGEAARARTLGPDAFDGSTCTITNNGAFGTLLTAAVINAPNVAIVSTDAVEDRPVVIDRMIAIRRRMYLTMTWDHRAFDGSTAGRFLAHVKRALE